VKTIRGEGAEVRAFLPEADEAWVIDEDSGREYPMDMVQREGFFLFRSAHSRTFTYRIRTRTHEGRTAEFADPYSFGVILTDFDLHLIGEGSHYRKYEESGFGGSPPFDRVLLFYHNLLSGASYRPHTLQLFPLDPGWLSSLKKKPWPARSRPVFGVEWRELFSLLVREYILVSLQRAFAESLLSENASRLLAMQVAERNIGEYLDGLTHELNNQRQSQITAELLDIVAGSEALFGGMEQIAKRAATADQAATAKLVKMEQAAAKGPAPEPQVPKKIDPGMIAALGVGAAGVGGSLPGAAAPGWTCDRDRAGKSGGPHPDRKSVV